MGDMIFLSIAVVFFLLALFDFIRYSRMKKQIVKATGIVINISMPAADSMKVMNSKHAHVGFYANGRYITSENSIVVPMDTEVGNSIDVWYVEKQPSKLFNKQEKRPIILFTVGIIFLAIVCINCFI